MQAVSALEWSDATGLLIDEIQELSAGCSRKQSGSSCTNGFMEKS
jgi:hypothetical protein